MEEYTEHRGVPEEDIMLIQPLGAGREVGRSCIYMKYKGKKILLDMGIHPGIKGLSGLPYLDEIEPKEIDILLITHFHIDHCGALPYFLAKTTFKGKIYMTHATKAIYRWILSDYIKVSNVSSNEESLFSEKDLEASLNRIETIDFHERKNVNGITFWCYHAGHVLGACMFMIEIAGVKVLYTGDFSRTEDRHLHAAEVPEVKPDVLICESTYGVHSHENQEDREKRFTSTIHQIIQRGGRVLIPVFALGRAQELLLILDEYWQKHPELHDVPIHYASSLARKCMIVYKTYANAMNKRINDQMSIKNPFHFKHISDMSGMKNFDDLGPSVVLASPGMLQSGLSRELFEKWADNPANGVILAGYTVQGTLAYDILKNHQPYIESVTGNKIPLKMQVENISFSAHVDYGQIFEFISIVKPNQVILVHGEENEQMKLKKELEKPSFFDHDIKFWNPQNTEKIELYFRGEKVAKVIGRLAEDAPIPDKELGGILVKRNFSYQIMSPEDIQKHTDLTVSTIVQRQAIRFSSSIEALQYHLLQLTEDVKIIETKDSLHMGLLAFGKIRLTRVQTTHSTNNHPHNVLIMEWNAGPVTDMLADACLAITLRVDALSGNGQANSNQPSAKDYSEKSEPKVLEAAQNQKFKSRLYKLLSMQYGDVIRDSNSHWRIEIGERIYVKINLDSLEVECEEDQGVADLIEESVKRLHIAVMPVTKFSVMSSKGSEEQKEKEGVKRLKSRDMDVS